ncbi:hypothetical protein [Xiamenia xianingshaonis]|uniref:Uncharacterized protein n=1 Tax=Xiamenia xianingshaonis TaxID=2682776 RepID=A0A9E6MRV9_9ACTN|nr:hypothetical protein [Xiamenia xianingshaonis]NHM14447.1 hypothetical protein [Xiamenia xianingshaonis]QTU84920.1 hypothetical protein J7S26_03145 [Xiamenia xianingshaonis]
MGAEVLADYAFYTDTYKGGLSEAAFYDCLPRALRHVRWLTGYREPIGCVEKERYQRAICAAVDAFADFGDGGIGFTLGSFKTNVRDGVAFSAEDKATQAALGELGDLSMAFCGVR